MIVAAMLEAAVDADLPALAALINRAYRGRVGWTTEDAYLSGDRTSTARLRQELAADRHARLLAWRSADEAPLGCVWIAPESDGTWYLGSLAIEPDAQAGGRGRMLLTAAERWITDRGGRRVRITVVNVRDALIAWYERRGYARTGVTEPFPYGDERFGKPLRDDLAFVVLAKAL